MTLKLLPPLVRMSLPGQSDAAPLAGPVIEQFKQIINFVNGLDTRMTGLEGQFKKLHEPEETIPAELKTKFAEKFPSKDSLITTERKLAFVQAMASSAGVGFVELVKDLVSLYSDSQVGSSISTYSSKVPSSNKDILSILDKYRAPLQSDQHKPDRHLRFLGLIGDAIREKSLSSQPLLNPGNEKALFAEAIKYFVSNTEFIKTAPKFFMKFVELGHANLDKVKDFLSPKDEVYSQILALIK